MTGFFYAPLVVLFAENPFYRNEIIGLAEC
jgi:hypothetical protein